MKRELFKACSIYSHPVKSSLAEYKPANSRKPLQRRFTSAGLLCIAIIFMVVLCGGCDGKKETQKHVEIDVPFDMTVDKLPVNYTGHEMTEIYFALSSWTPERKGEYETTAAYEARVQSDRKKMVKGSLGIDSVYAFSISRGNSEHVNENETLFSNI